MKSPVPVVMSYIGTCSPSRSTPVTRRPAPVSTAAASIDRRAVTAGSTGWKNRSASPSPPPTPPPARPRRAGPLGEAVTDAPDARLGQVVGRPGQPFPVLLARQREPEQEGTVGGPVELGIGVVAVAPVAADQAAQVPAPVGGGLLGRLGEAAGAHEGVAGRQVRTTPQPAEPAPGDVPPPVLGQEAVMPAANEPGAVP